VTCHDSCLPTDGNQNTPVEVKENEENQDVEGNEIPDPKGLLSGATFPEHQWIADAIYNIARGNCHRCSSEQSFGQKYV